MGICSICGEYVDQKELDNHLNIRLGDFLNGKFQGDATYYYHLICL